MKTAAFMMYITTIIICILIFRLEKQVELCDRQQLIIEQQEELIDTCISSLSEGAKIVTYNKENGK